MNGVEVSVAKSEDVGILSCEIGELCAEDTTSSLGGRCVAVSSDTVALEPQRELCNKCEGEGACRLVDQSKIGCGSCIGYGACAYARKNIGAGSCQGNEACQYALGELNAVLL